MEVLVIGEETLIKDLILMLKIKEELQMDLMMDFKTLTLKSRKKLKIRKNKQEQQRFSKNNNIVPIDRIQRIKEKLMNWLNHNNRITSLTKSKKN